MSILCCSLVYKHKAMNKNLLLLILLSVILFSCKHSTTQKDKSVYEYEVYKTQDIVLAEEDRGKYFAYNQLVNIDGGNILILNIGFSHLSFYNLERGEKVHDIFVDSVGMMRSSFFITKDSIFVGGVNLHGGNELETPQALRLVDWDGNVKKIYGYEVDNEELRNCKYDAENIIPPQNDEFVFCRGSIISRSTSLDSYGLLGTRESVENPLPIGIRMDTKDNKYHVSKQRKFAYIKEGMYYPTYELIYLKKTANDLPIFRYPYSLSAFEWDFENDSVIEHKFKSAIADSIQPLPRPAEYGYEIPCRYADVRYDECNRVYVSGVYFNEKIYGELKTGLIFADRDFLYIGEKYAPEFWPSVSNKNMTLNVRKKNDSTFTVRYLKLVKKDFDYDKYIDSCKNDLQAMRQNVENRKMAFSKGCPSINFVKSQMNIKETSYKILTLYGEGCIGCDQITLQTLYENREVLNKVPLYIIVSSRSALELRSYIINYGLTYFDKVAMDSSGIMKNLANSSYLLNPRITVVEDGVVTLDTIYQAQDIEDKLLPQIIGPLEHTKYVLDDNGDVIVVQNY